MRAQYIREGEQNGRRRVLERLSRQSLSPRPAPNTSAQLLTGDEGIKKDP